MKYMMFPYDDNYSMPLYTTSTNHSAVPATRAGALRRLCCVDRYTAFHVEIVSPNNPLIKVYKRRSDT